MISASQGDIEMNKVIYQENNESVALGVFPNNDGTSTAMTYSQSKTFKTLNGAKKMVRKQNRKKDLRKEATHSFINKIGVVCYGLIKGSEFFALSPEHDKWVAIPKWAFNKYFGE